MGVILLVMWLAGARYVAETLELDDPLLRQVWEAHNQERARMGLSPLHWNRLLMAAARSHVQDLAARRVLTHGGVDGSAPEQRVEAQGYHYGQMGENVAVGQRTVQEVMQTWMQSPPHRRNILGDFSDIGVAHALDAGSRPYWCVVFGRPAPSP
jgi:uncharacterized protein YkwD